MEIKLNIGGEGEEPEVVANLQPGFCGNLTMAMEKAILVKSVSKQNVIIAEGNRLPFADASIDEVITNNVPIDIEKSRYFGPTIESSEIYRVLKLNGNWTGTSSR